MGTPVNFIKGFIGPLKGEVGVMFGRLLNQVFFCSCSHCHCLDVGVKLLGYIMAIVKQCCRSVCQGPILETGLHCLHSLSGWQYTLDLCDSYLLQLEKGLPSLGGDLDALLPMIHLLSVGCGFGVSEFLGQCLNEP